MTIFHVALALMTFPALFGLVMVGSIVTDKRMDRFAKALGASIGALAVAAYVTLLVGVVS